MSHRDTLIHALDQEIAMLQRVRDLIDFGQRRRIPGVAVKNPLASIHQSEALKEMWARRSAAQC